MNHNASPPKNQRTIRSYVLRQGRIRPSQETSLEQYWSRYGIEIEEQYMDFNIIFQRQAPITLEIGFGMGYSLLVQAKQCPEKDFIGIEVHRPGIGSLLTQLHQQHLTNVRVISADAVDVLHRCIPDRSLDKIQIFFPDPWPKKRHHKRRLIQPEFVALLTKKLKPQGLLHLATDWEDYAQHMMTVLIASNCFTRIDLIDQRPMTKFENRGKKLGHQVWDLLYKLR
jgi:tRNA (guanine-N7-)-methyltransferase